MTILDDLDEGIKDEYGASGYIKLPNGGYRIYINYDEGSFEFYAPTAYDLRSISFGIKRVIKLLTNK